MNNAQHITSQIVERIESLTSFSISIRREGTILPVEIHAECHPVAHGKHVVIADGSIVLGWLERGQRDLEFIQNREESDPRRRAFWWFSRHLRATAEGFEVTMKRIESGFDLDILK